MMLKNGLKITRFNQSFELAIKEKINVDLSNEVFELWLLIHFIMPEYDRTIPRKEIYSLLESNISVFDQDFNYRHGKSDIVNYVYQNANEKLAIANAKVLEKFHEGKNLSNLTLLLMSTN